LTTSFCSTPKAASCTSQSCGRHPQDHRTYAYRSGRIYSHPTRRIFRQLARLCPPEHDLSGRNLFPNLVSIEAHNYYMFSPYQKYNLTPHWSQRYHSRRFGTCETCADTTSVFQVKVDSLKSAIRDWKHVALFNSLRPLATGLVKKQIQKALQDVITTGLEYVDGQLVGVGERMNQAKASDETRLRDLLEHKKSEAASVKSNKDGDPNTIISFARDEQCSLGFYLDGLISIVFLMYGTHSRRVIRCGWRRRREQGC